MCAVAGPMQVLTSLHRATEKEETVSSLPRERLTLEELEAECGAVLPAKEVLSVPHLDLNVDINLALDLAAPIDLAVAGNASVALPINAGVSANALSALSVSQSGAS